MHFSNFHIAIFLSITLLLTFIPLIRFIEIRESHSVNSYEGFQIHKGTNISHWLSQSKRRGVERKMFFQKEDVAFLAGLGFDHIRIPLDEEQMFDETGNKDDEAFALLHQALGWCQEYGLRAIIDLHILRSHHFNTKEKTLWTDTIAQHKFIEIWQKLSEELSLYPNGMLAYELMNEPTADDPDDWNHLLARAYVAIREKEAERTIVIGSNRWQSTQTFHLLKVPANDKNILLSFHFYEPFLFTHYQAPWSAVANYDGPIHYPGKMVNEEDLKTLSPSQRKFAETKMRTYSKEILEKRLKKAIRISNALGLPLYCGEWGAIRNAPQEDRLRWYRDMKDIFETNNIAYANWDYKSDNFGLINWNGTFKHELVKIFTPVEQNK